MVVRYDSCKFTKRKILRPSLKLIGAKTKQRSFLYQFFPNNYTYFVDVFMGTGGVTIGASHNAYEICTDINKDAIIYYHVLQSNPEKFWEQLQSELAILYMNGLDDVEWGRVCFERWKHSMNTNISIGVNNTTYCAVLFYLITKHAFNGIWRRNKEGMINSSYGKKIRGRGVFDRKWFQEILNRIQEVDFRHKDFRTTLLQFENSKDVFLFCDPPYRRTKGIKGKKGCVTDYNGVRFTDKDHAALRYYLGRQDGNWLLTINDDEWIRELYKGYYILDRDVFYSCSNTPAGRHERPELLVANYDIGRIQYNLDGKQSETPIAKAK